MKTHDVTLRPFDLAEDLPRLRVWLHQPHVAPWWGAPDAALADARRRPAEAHAIIVADERPVGYLCWEAPDPEDLAAAGLTDLPENLVDVDILLGEVDALGQGLGPQAGVLLLDRLRQRGDASCIGVAMSVANKRAIRAAAKLGFEPFADFDDPESGPSRYMVLRVPSALRS